MNIKQIMPANGWYAVVIDLEDENYQLENIVAWALVDAEDVCDQVVGLYADQSPTVEVVAEPQIRAPGENFGFFEYVHQQTLDDLNKFQPFHARVKSYISRSLDPNDSLGT